METRSDAFPHAPRVRCKLGTPRSASARVPKEWEDHGNRIKLRADGRVGVV
jgi:hypothetical protein